MKQKAFKKIYSKPYDGYMCESFMLGHKGKCVV